MAPPTAHKIDSGVKPLQAPFGSPLTQDLAIAREQTERVIAAFAKLLSCVLAKNRAVGAQVTRGFEHSRGGGAVLSPGLVIWSQQPPAHAIARVRPEFVRVIQSGIVPFIDDSAVRTGEDFLVLPQVTVVAKGPVSVVVHLAPAIDRRA